jgi:hypothetical protein
MAASRRTRADDMTADDLFYLGRAQFFAFSPGDAIAALRAAAAKGHEEAAWLADQISLPAIKRFLDFSCRVRSAAYRGYAALYAISGASGMEGYDWDKRARDELAQAMSDGGIAEGFALYVYTLLHGKQMDYSLTRQAADLGEPLACSYMFFFKQEIGLELVRQYCRRAVSRYVFERLFSTHRGVHIVDDMVLRLRCSLFQGELEQEEWQSCFARATDDEKYALGKEFADAHTLYTRGLRFIVDDEYARYRHWGIGSCYAKQMTTLYRHVSHACRRMSLFIVWCLRRYQVHPKLTMGRDIATMIGKMVYRTRSDTELWSGDKFEDKAWYTRSPIGNGTVFTLKYTS